MKRSNFKKIFLLVLAGVLIVVGAYYLYIALTETDYDKMHKRLIEEEDCEMVKEDVNHFMLKTEEETFSYTIHGKELYSFAYHNEEVNDDNYLVLQGKEDLNEAREAQKKAYYDTLDDWDVTSEELVQFVFDYREKEWKESTAKDIDELVPEEWKSWLKTPSPKWR